MSGEAYQMDRRVANEDATQQLGRAIAADRSLYVG